MPLIHTDKIKEAVYNLCVIANTTIEKPFYEKILGLYNSTGDEKYALILQNIEISHKKSRPLCQDTGQVVLFVKVGQNVQISGENLENALNNAVAKAYEENFYRKSVVSNAIFERKNTKTNTPAIIYTEISSGDEIEINLLVKGAGSENYGAVKMFNPADTKEEIFEFIKETIQKAGERACPPLVLGIGAGGTMDYVALLSKKAFFSPMSAAEIALKKELLGYLDGPQGHGQETIQQPHQQGAEERTDQRDQHSQKRIKLRYMLLIQKRANHAADTAHIHNTGNTQVQVAGFLRQDLAGGAEQNRHALHHGTLEQRDPSR